MECASLEASGVAAVVLAAGRSTRMASGNKLLADVEGKPMLHRTLDAIDGGDGGGSRLQPIVVVTGFQSEQIAASIAQRRRPVEIAHNPDYLQGLGTSLRTGIASLPDSTGAAIIFLADMPDITADVPNHLVSAHLIAKDKICVPVIEGKRGNPVLWPRRYFQDLSAVEGDVGGRHLLRKFSDSVQEVPVSSDSILNDMDTVQDLKLRSVRRQTG